MFKDQGKLDEFKIKFGDECSFLWQGSLLKDGGFKKKKFQTNTAIVKLDILNREIKRGTTLFLAQKKFLFMPFIHNKSTN